MLCIVCNRLDISSNGGISSPTVGMIYDSSIKHQIWKLEAINQLDHMSQAFLGCSVGFFERGYNQG
tara:strand:+ start:932 stop:1129 length:198 start_codon:yes stop_codon:yes gene_type:complete